MTATIEDVKEYWNRQPCNVKHSKKEVGTREYFEEVERKDTPQNHTFLDLLTSLHGRVRKF